MSLARMSARYRRGLPKPDVELTHRTVGNAMVVHAGNALTDEALALARSIAPDPDHHLVVVDLPEGSPIWMWEALAAGLPRGKRGVRLVIGGRSREATALAGQWLAERLGRTVVAPDGVVTRGADGSLFVHSGKGSGWVRFRPGKAPQWEAKRFPRPSWDARAVAEFFPTSSTGAAEPLPGGVWIRPVGHDPAVRAGRSLLINELSCQPDVLSVVLGCPGTPAITIDDITRFCAELSAELLAKVRFVRYGPVRVQEEDALGQVLADALGIETVLYTGMPVGSAQLPEVFTVCEDGTLGWHTFGQQLAFQPRTGPSDPLPPVRLHQYRRPLYGVPEIAPALYWYAQDAVLEVVRAGLWIRPPGHEANATMVRSVPADPTANLVVFDGATAAQTDRMRILAEDVQRRLDRPLRQVTRVVPATALFRAPVVIKGKALAELDSPAPAAVPSPAEPIPDAAAPVGRAIEQPGPPDLTSTVSIQPADSPEQATVMQEPSQPAAPAVPAESAPELSAPARPARRDPLPKPEAAAFSPGSMRLESAPTGAPVAEPREPSRPTGAAREPKVAKTSAPVTETGARRQPTPSSAASALLPAQGIDRERAWLRENLGTEFGLLANTIGRVLSEHPGFQGALSPSSSDVLTEAVAVRMYLSQQGAEIDRALRTGKAGPHVPLARCVVAGLRRLPSHRGAAVFRMSPSSAQWDLFAGSKLCTEWGFLNALTDPCAAQEGDIDVLVWSMTARRTKLLEAEENRTEDRVVFLPGTSFKVLYTQPSEPGQLGQVLMRELAESEIDAGGQVDTGRISLDELAMKSLQHCAQRWAQAEPRLRVPSNAADRFQNLPGLA